MTKGSDFIENVSVSKPKGKQRTHSLVRQGITLLEYYRGRSMTHEQGKLLIKVNLSFLKWPLPFRCYIASLF